MPLVIDKDNFQPYGSRMALCIGTGNVIAKPQKTIFLELKFVQNVRKQYVTNSISII